MHDRYPHSAEEIEDFRKYPGSQVGNSLTNCVELLSLIEEKRGKETLLKVCNNVPRFKKRY